jgi:dTDP-glucose 4,6-dehydratase
MTETHNPRRMLVTGGAGFIGSNFIRATLEARPGVEILNVDALTYAGTLANLEGLDARRHSFVHADIRDREAMREVFTEYRPDTVVNFAADTHVDRSIDSPLPFVETNALGTAVLLEAARGIWKDDNAGTRFHHISTDEVFGSLGAEGKFNENSPIRPSSPYSASKAAADLLVGAYHRTFGLNTTISNCSNNYGPRQFPEKLIPLMIRKALREEALPVYGKGSNVRDWLHVRDHADAVWAILTRGRPGALYPVGGDNEWNNLDLVRLLCEKLDAIRPRDNGKKYSDLIAFVTDRPGHDARYAIDNSRMTRELGWSPRYTFEDGLEQTIHWYLENEDWVKAIEIRTYAGERLGLGKSC